MRKLARPSWPAVVFFAGWGAYFCIIWSRALRFDGHGDVIAGYATLWADWAAHFTFGSGMAFRKLFLTQSPLLIHEPFRYPFACDLLSALAIRAGVPFLTAFVAPSFFATLALLGALYALYRGLFQSPSAAAIGATLFFFTGGVGFLHLFQAARATHDVWHALAIPVERATAVDDWNIVWKSVIGTLLIPQRAIQFGLPMGIAALILSSRRLLTNSERPPRTCTALVAGLLWGLLPIVHAHTFLAVSGIIGCWAVGDLFFSTPEERPERFRFWGFLIGVAVMVALPCVRALHLDHGSGTKTIRWTPGWYAKSVPDWIQFWFLNWGIMPVIAVLGATEWIRARPLRSERRTRVLLALPFAILFAVINLFVFQPWIWDNTKLLIWVAIGFSGFAGYWIVRRKRVTAVVVFIVLSLSGGFDAYRLLLPSLNQSRMYTHEEWELADWVRQNTPVDSVWLTGWHHNNWLYNLTGRQTVMAYEGWLWSHGYRYGKVKSDVPVLFAHPDNEALLTEYGITNAAIGPVEKRNFNPNIAEFEKHFNLIHQTENYRIYRLVKNAEEGTTVSSPPGGRQ